MQASECWQNVRMSEVELAMLTQADMKHPPEYPPGVTVVGYRDEGFIYLLPEIAHREISRVQPLRFTVTAIGMQLKEDGLLFPNSVS